MATARLLRAQLDRLSGQTGPHPFAATLEKPLVTDEMARSVPGRADLRPRNRRTSDGPAPG